MENEFGGHPGPYSSWRKFKRVSHAVKMLADILPISFDHGKSLVFQLTPLSFWRTFNNLQRMFGNDTMHHITLSHSFDLGPEWREAQQKRREEWDARLLSLGSELVSQEPSWMIHEDQYLMDDHDAKYMALEIFRGATTSQTMDALTPLFPDLNVTVSSSLCFLPMYFIHLTCDFFYTVAFAFLFDMTKCSSSGELSWWLPSSSSPFYQPNSVICRA